MRKTLGVPLLVLLLTAPAVAGEMPNPAPSPLSKAPNAVQEPTDAATFQYEIPNDVADSLTQTALEVLAALPSLFY